jgi:hypothetical protein
MLMETWEVYRINWIRSISIRDRWKEELTIVTSEMEWYVRYMYYRKAQSLVWAATEGIGEGGKAYAYRQGSMWNSLAVHAAAEFAHHSGVSISI